MNLDELRAVQNGERATDSLQALRDSPYVDLEDPEPEQALNWARDHDAPLHPKFTSLWHDIDDERFELLAEAVAEGWVEDEVLHLAREESVREVLEVLLVEHSQRDDELVVSDWLPFVRTLGKGRRWCFRVSGRWRLQVAGRRSLRPPLRPGGGRPGRGPAPVQPGHPRTFPQTG